MNFYLECIAFIHCIITIVEFLKKKKNHLFLKEEIMISTCWKEKKLLHQRNETYLLRSFGSSKGSKIFFMLLKYLVIFLPFSIVTTY